MDTGVNTGHTDFGGRASLGFTAVTGTTDTAGHGTHVAGTIAGKTYGIAKSARVIAVKVFDGESGTTSDVLSGYDWAVNDIINKGRENVAAISMSLGKSLTLDCLPTNCSERFLLTLGYDRRWLFFFIQQRGKLGVGPAFY